MPSTYFLGLLLCWAVPSAAQQPPPPPYAGQNVSTAQQDIGVLQRQQHVLRDQLHTTQDDWQQHKDLSVWLTRARSKLQRELLLATTSRADRQETALSLQQRNAQLTSWTEALQSTVDTNQVTLDALMLSHSKLSDQFDTLSAREAELVALNYGLQQSISKAADVMADELSSSVGHAAILSPVASANSLLAGELRDKKELSQELELRGDLLVDRLQELTTASPHQEALKLIQIARKDQITAQYVSKLEESLLLEASRDALSAGLETATITNRNLRTQSTRLEIEHAALQAENNRLEALRSAAEAQKLIAQQHAVFEAAAFESSKTARDIAQIQSNVIVSAARGIECENCKARVTDLQKRNAKLTQTITLLNTYSSTNILGGS